jgi:NTE family protein
MIGALSASGVPPWFMVAHSRGEVFDGVTDVNGHPAADADRAAGARFELVRTWPPIGPGSWRLALRTLVDPRRYTPTTVVSGWIPRGIFPPRRSGHDPPWVPSGWGPPPTSGSSPGLNRATRAVRPAAPVPISPAVAASCGIPGIYHPQTIAGRHYVDGGIYSTSNADLLRGGPRPRHRLNPTSTLHPIRALNPREWLNLAMRNASGRRLGTSPSSAPPASNS